MARGKPGRVTLSIRAAEVGAPQCCPRPPSDICGASRRGEFRYRRAEFLDGAAAPPPHTMTNRRSGFCRTSRTLPVLKALSEGAHISRQGSVSALRRREEWEVIRRSVGQKTLNYCHLSQPEGIDDDLALVVIVLILTQE
jgi:hypothetical protein